MYHGEWTFRACPQCISDQISRTVRANVTSFDCLSCQYQWTVRRMPSNAEAVDILRRAREKILPEDAGSTQLDADSDRPARLLWTQNMRDAAIRLECLWNELATPRDFSLLCGYSTAHSSDDTAVRAVCEKHTHVISAEREAAPS